MSQSQTTSRVTHTMRHVPDEDQALAFYTGVLGFEVRADQMVGPNMRWLTVGVPDQPELEVVLYNPARWDSGEERDAKLRTLEHQPQLIIQTPDIDALLVRLKAAGVRLDFEEVRTLPWGRDLAFRDPGGASINAVQPPQP
jgi:catechol 2,3-dioxygenase-like lactoylglutathione lyase family enzyme